MRSNWQISIYLFLFSRRTYCQLIIIGGSKDAIVCNVVESRVKVFPGGAFKGRNTFFSKNISWLLFFLKGPPVETENVMPMEELPINNDGGQGYGFILYQTELDSPPEEIIVHNVSDRAQVYNSFSVCTESKKYGKVLKTLH